MGWWLPGVLPEGLQRRLGEVRFGHRGEEFGLHCAEFEVLERLPGPPPQAVGNHGSSLSPPPCLTSRPLRPAKSGFIPVLDLIQAKGGNHLLPCFLSRLSPPLALPAPSRSQVWGEGQEGDLYLTQGPVPLPYARNKAGPKGPPTQEGKPEKWVSDGNNCGLELG